MYWYAVVIIMETCLIVHVYENRCSLAVIEYLGILLFMKIQCLLTLHFQRKLDFLT